jgi:hypothetical protein
MKSLSVLLTSAALVMSLAACSVKKDVSEDLPDIPQNKTETFDHLVQGPNLDGTWSSDCVYDSSDRNYNLKQIRFEGQKVTRLHGTYQDRACQTEIKVYEANGKFRYKAATSYGGFEVDYRFDLGGGATQITKEELLLEGENLYLSDFTVGFGVISKDMPLKKIQQ